MLNDGDQPRGPAGPEETDAYTRAYDDALSRLLDGLDVSDGEGDAQARAGADVALISRALRLIGAAAAGDAELAGRPVDGNLLDSALVDSTVEGGVGADRDDDTAVIALAGAGADVTARPEVDARVLPLRPVPPPAEPVEIEDAPEPTRRRVPSSGVLAAAASLVLIVSLGVTGVLNAGGSSGDNNAAVQQPAPAGAAADAASPAQSEATAAGGRAGGDAYDGAAAAPAADAAAEAAAPAADTAAAAAPASTSAKAAKAAKKAKSETLAETVGCARAIVVGELVGVTDAKLSYRSRWTLRITEWVKPASGPAEATYVVGGPRARLAGGSLGTLAAGQAGLFVVPADKDAPMRAWTGGDTRSGRDKVEAALAEGWSGGC